MTGGRTESVPVEAIRTGDIVEDPGSGRWITVSRVVDGQVRASEHDTYTDESVTQSFWSIYGDERLDEVITVHDRSALLQRRIPD